MRSTTAGRLPSGEATTQLLTKWLQGWQSTPPVVLPFPEAEPPTALAWLRRRGPPVPEAMLQKLFRAESVRVYDPAMDQVRRVGRAAVLAPGARVLLPKSVLSEEALPSAPRSRHSPPARPAADSTLAQHALRQALLQDTPHWLAINKPAGLAVQGGTGVRVSVDSAMHAAFTDEVSHSARLKLVHRLDREATGVLLVAKGADAAAQLGLAFQQSTAGLSTQHSGNSGQVAAVSVKKTYWAVVCSSDGGARPLRASATGTISDPIPKGSDKGDDKCMLPAQTQYEVLASSGPLAWVQLRPLTGRKHQLRLHCANALGAPILGDSRYGTVRSGDQRAALDQVWDALQRDPAKYFGRESEQQAGRAPPLFLHCRSLTVRLPGERQVHVTAPLPPAWRALIDAMRWKKS